MTWRVEINMVLFSRRSRGRFPCFLVAVFLLLTIGPASLPAQTRAEFNEVDRIVVVGDLHGDFEMTKKVLQMAGLVDNRNRWTGGKTHLVQMGDIPDRGPGTRDILKYSRTLSKRARRDGGRIHFLIGNHESMNVYGDLRYVHDGEYKAFANRQSKARLEALYEQDVAWIKENVPEDEQPVMDDVFRTKWFEARPAGWLEHRWNWLPDGDIGKWVLKQNAVIKIGDLLLVHGGLGPQYATATIEEINDAVREALKDPDNVEGTIVRDQEGPLWYRGLALNPEEEERPHLEALLDNFEAERIILAHTVTAGIILPRFGGRVILTDVGLSSYYGGNLACLLIEGEAYYADPVALLE